MASPSPKKLKSPKTWSKQEIISPSSSPGSSPNRRQLSDVSRRIRDCCAKLHESVQKWSSLNELGTTVANRLVNLRLQMEYNKIGDTTRVDVGVHSNQDSAMHLQDKITESSQELSKIYNSLVHVHKKMSSLVQSFDAIHNLKSLGRKDECGFGEVGEIPFNTWTTQQFCDASTKLLSSFSKELSLKESLMVEFSRCRNRNDLMVYLSLWLNQPYLEDDNDVVLEAMLIDVELR